jgi:hypothetical protein
MPDASVLVRARIRHMRIATWGLRLARLMVMLRLVDAAVAVANRSIAVIRADYAVGDAGLVPDRTADLRDRASSVGGHQALPASAP